MICNECKEKDLIRGVKRIRCVSCMKPTTVNSGYNGNICENCSNHIQKCICCGQNIYNSHSLDKKEIYNKEIAPLLQSIMEICTQYNIAYACQFALKTIDKDGHHLMAMICDTTGSNEISEVACTMCRVQDSPL